MKNDCNALYYSTNGCNNKVKNLICNHFNDYIGHPNSTAYDQIWASAGLGNLKETSQYKLMITIVNLVILRVTFNKRQLHRGTVLHDEIINLSVWFIALFFMFLWFYALHLSVLYSVGNLASAVTHVILLKLICLQTHTHAVYLCKSSDLRKKGFPDCVIVPDSTILPGSMLCNWFANLPCKVETFVKN